MYILRLIYTNTFRLYLFIAIAGNILVIFLTVDFIELNNFLDTVLLQGLIATV